MSKKEKDKFETVQSSDFVVSTYSGNCKQGNKDGKVELSSFYRPTGICVVKHKQNAMYISDSFNNSIRKIVNNEVTTIQIKHEKEEESCLLRSPQGITERKNGELIIADTDNHRICMVRPDGTFKSLIGRSSENNYRLCGPHDVAEEKNGIVISDTFNHKIRFYEEGKLSTIAGSIEGYADGVGEEAKFNKPMGISVDSKGNIYVCDTYNYKIRKISPQGLVTTLAGSTKGHEDGNGKDAKFGRPTGILCTKSGLLFVTDNDPPCIRKISSSGYVTTITGKVMGYADGPADKAKFYVLGFISMDLNEDLYITDTYNNCIRKLSLVNKE